MADGRWVRRTVLAALVGVLTLTGVVVTGTTAAGEVPDRDVAGPVDVGGRQVYLECRGPSRPGRPTVVLMSGFGNAADIWSIVDPSVAPPPEPVLSALARTERVCAYDRPGSLLLESGAVGDRSTPVPQPRTAGDWVAELHTLLRAAQVPGPYLLVGHSLGGLAARLYASTHPEEVAGLVLVDATNEDLPDLLGPGQWEFLTAPPPTPGLEQIDWDASIDQVVAARAAVPLRPGLPLIVLSAGRFDELPPDLPDPEGLVRAQRAAQADLARLLPGARQVIAEESSHYIQLTEPELVVDAVGDALRDVGGQGAGSGCPRDHGPR